jgi:uncharacterized membrane protein
MELLPDPELLRRYNEAFGAGSAERLMEQFVLGQEHSRKLELQKLTCEYDLQRREQRSEMFRNGYAFVIGLAAIIGGLVLAETREVTGGLISGGTVAGIVYAFLRTRTEKP